MPIYIRQLRCLLGREVVEADLLSLEETETIRGRSLATSRPIGLEARAPFSALGSARFSEYVGALAEAGPPRAYVWSPLANVCGLHKPVPLSDINWGFDYALIPDGIVSLVGEALQNGLILDFDDDEPGGPWLDIETRGTSWGFVAY